MQIGIIGGGGHVGLPTGLVFADAGHSVTLIDKDSQRLEEIRSGEMPFSERGGKVTLRRVLDAGNLSTTTDLSVVSEVDAVVIVIGTPIDRHNNPEMDQLLQIIEEIQGDLQDKLVILRSTIYPGTTKIVRESFEEYGLTVGEDVFLSFAPERVAQHKALEEIVSLPQLVGCFDETSYQQTEQLFSSILDSQCLQLTPAEAEIGKLFTNMWRYLTFAAANEFYLIAESFAQHHDVNIHRILDKTGKNYPRFDVPSPGANVGGPCLTKDGWFLVENIPYNELLSTAFQINEGIPSQLIERMAETVPDPEKITVLGMTFKKNSDDTRNSVAFKLEKQLQMKGYSNIVTIEPNCTGFDEWDEMQGSEWLILMTPHDEFQDLSTIASHVDNPDCLVCDIWGFWEEIKYKSDNGYFFMDSIASTTAEHAEVEQ